MPTLTLAAWLADLAFVACVAVAALPPLVAMLVSAYRGVVLARAEADAIRMRAVEKSS